MKSLQCSFLQGIYKYIDKYRYRDINLLAYYDCLRNFCVIATTQSSTELNNINWGGSIID